MPDARLQRTRESYQVPEWLKQEAVEAFRRHLEEHPPGTCLYCDWKRDDKKLK